jgi:uncharacterized protein YaeQ
LALKATIFKASVQISDTDRNYYQAHALTLARHPSETDERMMVRLLAFALNAHEYLTFGKGLSTDDEPDLWRKDLTGAIEQWIDVGQPDEKRLRKACGRANDVVVYSYGGSGAQLWRESVRDTVARCRNLVVHSIPLEASQAMAKFADRAMTLTYTIQDGDVWIANERDTLHIKPERMAAAES